MKQETQKDLLLLLWSLISQMKWCYVKDIMAYMN
jgi:hypothetical protein